MHIVDGLLDLGGGSKVVVQSRVQVVMNALVVAVQQQLAELLALRLAGVVVSAVVALGGRGGCECDRDGERGGQRGW
jgi:hypothetical protein